VGLKPGLGGLPLDGFQPLSPTLDHGGLLTATVEDAAVLLDAITGSSTVSTLKISVSDLRIAYARSWSDGVAEPAIQNALDAAIQNLRHLGAHVTEVEIPDYADYEACGTVIIQHEALQTYATLLKSERAAGIGRLAFQNLVTGAVLTDDDVALARKRQSELRAAFGNQIFGPFDALVCASTLTTAPPFSYFDAGPRWTAMRTFPFNVTGHPALAMPTGLAPDGLPMGLQLVGPKGGEAMILQIGHALETRLNLRFSPIPDATASNLN
jgi:aspartyl-tRNA(Asn)/glutamyl-tRNA(Gln) amidotransferase subunit A